MFTHNFQLILQQARKEQLKSKTKSNTGVGDLVTSVRKMDLHTTVENLDENTKEMLEKNQSQLKRMTMVLARYVELGNKIGKELMENLLAQDALLAYSYDKDREKYEAYVRLISLWSNGIYTNPEIQTIVKKYQVVLMSIAKILTDFDNEWKPFLAS